MLETLLKSLETLRIYSQKRPRQQLQRPKDLALSLEDRQELRRLLASPGWQVLGNHYRAAWQSAANRLISAKSEELVKRQAEVVTLEKVLNLPYVLLEQDKETE